MPPQEILNMQKEQPDTTRCPRKSAYLFTQAPKNELATLGRNIGTCRLN